MNDCYNRESQQKHKLLTSLGCQLNQDFHLKPKLFKSSLLNLDVDTQVKCSVALNHLVELHYDKRHLLDVIRRQQEEIDWTRNKIRDSGTLIQHLESVKVVLVCVGTGQKKLKFRAPTRIASKNRPLIGIRLVIKMSRSVSTRRKFFDWFLAREQNQRLEH